MKTKQILFSAIVITTVLITACGASAAPTKDAMMEKPTDTAMADPMADETPSAEAMMEAPAWYSASLTNASTGQTFAIQDFKGKVVLVEAMAIWCSKCLQQQSQVKALHGLLGQRDDFVSNGFDWLYAVPSADLSRELSSLYGDQFLNPPSTPIVILDRQGEAHPMPFGIKSADELLQFIQPFLDEAM